MILTILVFVFRGLLHKKIRFYSRRVWEFGISGFWFLMDFEQLMERIIYLYILKNFEIFQICNFWNIKDFIKSYNKNTVNISIEVFYQNMLEYFTERL